MYWELARKRALWLQTTSSKQLKILLCLIAVIWLLASTRIQVIIIYIVCRNVCIIVFKLYALSTIFKYL